MTLAVLLGLILAGCTRFVDDAKPQAQAPVAPITAGQVADLLSDKVDKVDADPNLFTAVEPGECAGIAREVDPPFIFDAKPAAHAGGRYYAETGPPSVSVVEMVGVYRANFKPATAVDEVKRTIESCRNKTLTTTTMHNDVHDFRLLPHTDSGSADIVLWSLDAGGWSCDNAYTAAHNAAIEITTCAEVNGYDVFALAQDALKRIETLANKVA